MRTELVTQIEKGSAGKSATPPIPAIVDELYEWFMDMPDHARLATSIDRGWHIPFAAIDCYDAATHLNAAVSASAKAAFSRAGFTVRNTKLAQTGDVVVAGTVDGDTLVIQVTHKKVYVASKVPKVKVAAT